MNLSKFNFILDLEKDYDSNPAMCHYCHKPIKFKKFYSQLELPIKFCCKKCKKSFELENNQSENTSNSFSSETEKIIYTYLIYKYPFYIIRHNVIDAFPPYEIDICLETPDENIYIEFNSNLHFPKIGKLQKSSVRHQLNDVAKRTEICEKHHCKLIRIWSKTGLYSKPDRFNTVLTQLKQDIDYLINAKNKYGQCIDIVVERNGEIFRYNNKYKIQNETIY